MLVQDGTLFTSYICFRSSFEKVIEMVERRSDSREKEVWPASGRGQIPSLDGLRAVSIMIVFFSHAGLSQLIPGGFGVTVFFFLSGFLITMLLTREHARTGGIAFGAFYLRRVLRLIPPLLLTIALGLGLVALGWAPGDMSFEATLAQVFFVYNYYSLLPGAEQNAVGFGVLWSLSVEEHFYLIWPVLFLLIARGRIGTAHLVGLLAAIVIWRFVRVLILNDGEWAIYISTDTRFDSLLYGCLLAILMARGGLPDWLHRPQIFYAMLGAGLAALLMSFLWSNPVFRSTLRYSLQGLALMPIFFYAVTRSDHILFQFLNNRIMRRIGIYSYTLYLVHFVILNALWSMGYPREGLTITIVYAAVFSLLWAAIVYRFAEQPLHGLRSRLHTQQPRAS